MEPTSPHTIVILAMALALLAPLTADGAQTEYHNIARGCPVTLNTAPNYELCTDENDAVQLTDGEHCPDGTVMWVHKGTVGWICGPPVMFTIDLGKVQPISGVSYSTAAGFAGVSWPSSILLLVSDDNEDWRLVGDLVRLSRSQPPPLGEYARFTYVTHELTAKGRYVKLAIAPVMGAYVFADEVEVYAGAESAAVSSGEVIHDLVAFMRDTQVASGPRARIADDAAYVRKALGESTIAPVSKKKLGDRLDRDERQVASVDAINALTFKAILPLNKAHADIFNVYSSVMRSRGFPEFFVWKKHRYDPLGRFELPSQPLRPVEISISMMRKEFRSDSFLLTNTSGKPVKARLTIEGLPGSPTPTWLMVSSVPWTDTSSRIPIAAALPKARRSGNAYEIDVPSGMTRKIWLTVDSSKLKSGAYVGSCSVEYPGGALQIPFNLRVSRLAMGKPRLSLGMWDYTSQPELWGITKKNKAACIRLMRSHFYDSPWAQNNVLPHPSAGDFDSSNQLKVASDFTVLDQWMKLWPGARYYMVFASVNDSFAGEKIGSEAFHQKVGSWAKEIAAHLRQIGIKPGQFAMLLYDEPREDLHDQINVAWTRAIKDYAPNIAIFTDPLWERPDLRKDQDAFLKADIICPHLVVFSTGTQEARDYYERLRAQGKTLWFYQCSGPVKLYDPDKYYRMQAWYSFKHNATGMGFWAFGDTGGCVSSWNEYTATGVPFTPVFLAPDSATSGIHWEAVREGIEDYECLAMLRDAADKSQDQSFKTRSAALLAEIERKVTPGYRDDYVDWTDKADRSLADTYRLKALYLLESATR